MFSRHYTHKPKAWKSAWILDVHLGIINHLGSGAEEHRHLKYEQRKGGYEENREGMAKDGQEEQK